MSGPHLYTLYVEEYYALDEGGLEGCRRTLMSLHKSWKGKKEKVTLRPREGILSLYSSEA